ncbi:MAG TPA: Uma2 family endonuclease [Pyrinomonadaceae bacterium]|jgi:Uma2 family endonuclease
MSAVLTETQSKLMTADELLVLPNSRYGYELVRGKLKKYMPGGNLHGIIIGRLARLISNYVHDNNLGETPAAETGYKIFFDPDTVRAPDISFISKEKLMRIGITEKFFPAAPDLAVEVVSPNDREKDIQGKIADYLIADVPLIWIVRPKNQTITVYRPDQEPQVLSRSNNLDGGNALPGFSCSLEQIFGNLPEIKE